MKINLEMFNADKRRAKREVVKTITVNTGADVGEHESIEKLQRARADLVAASAVLKSAEHMFSDADEALIVARRDVRRVSER